MTLLICWLVTIVSVIISIPFLTLLERKVLSYVQFRKGPNKVSFLGILQPIADGVKLVLKESGHTTRTNNKIFWLSPLFNFFFMLILYLLFSSFYPHFSLNLGILGYLCISSLMVYSILGSGWSSNSKFSFLGSLRGAAQIISYEISLLIVLFFPCLLNNSYNLNVINNGFGFIVLFFCVIFICWLISIVAETNRSPFDFAEGESELVSGFNTEYSGLVFALLFLGEYGNIIFVSLLTCFLFFPETFLLQPFLALSIMFLFLLFRGTFPRFRYDFLMTLSWKVILPLSFMLLWVIFFF